MTAHQRKEGGRFQFGALSVTPSPSPQEEAINAMGQAVPGLEAALGFPLSVTVGSKGAGLIWVDLVLPDAHYSGSNIRRIRQALRDAARPFGQFVYVETDSDAPYSSEGGTP